jgi:hypothetical protein
MSQNQNNENPESQNEALNPEPQSSSPQVTEIELFNMSAKTIKRLKKSLKLMKSCTTFQEFMHRHPTAYKYLGQKFPKYLKEWKLTVPMGNPSEYARKKSQSVTVTVAPKTDRAQECLQLMHQCASLRELIDNHPSVYNYVRRQCTIEFNQWKSQLGIVTPVRTPATKAVPVTTTAVTGPRMVKRYKSGSLRDVVTGQIMALPEFYQLFKKVNANLKVIDNDTLQDVTKEIVIRAAMTCESPDVLYKKLIGR